MSSIGNLVDKIDKIEQSNRGIHEGIANLSTFLNDRFVEIIAGINNDQRIINDKLNELIQNFNSYHADHNKHQSEIKDFLSEITNVLNDRKRSLDAAPRPQESEPLLRAPKTYNTDHPDYDPNLVRNFPGVLLNGDKPSANPALRAVRQMMDFNAINDRAWPDQLEMALAELKSIPGSEQLFQRKAIAERFFLDLNGGQEPHYQPGWMNLDDGLFLYWLVRRLRPRNVVETGVANGFSTGLILLAMAKNGNDGKLYAIGRAEVFDAADSRWTEEGKVFGAVVVDGKSLGWMAPDNCRAALELHDGDARALLPEVVAKLDEIDLFFHDSDHTYDHMMFEFETASCKLSASGVIVADNIAWNSSLWDFADDHGVPAYNFRGSVGAAFFG